MSSDKDNLEVILEDMNGKFNRMLEIVSLTREEMATKAELEEVKSDVKVIKAAVIDQNAQLNDHERRITHLEAA